MVATTVLTPFLWKNSPDDIRPGPTSPRRRHVVTSRTSLTSSCRSRRRSRRHVITSSLTSSRRQIVKSSTRQLVNSSTRHVVTSSRRHVVTSSRRHVTTYCLLLTAYHLVFTTYFSRRFATPQQPREQGSSICPQVICRDR